MDDAAAAYVAIQQLQRAYADIATRGAWDEFAAIATPDAHFTFDIRAGQRIEIDGPVEFGAFGVRANERFSFYEFVPLNFVVTFAADGTARGRSYSLEVAEDRESGDWVEFFGVYDDEYAVFDGAWRFARRRYRTYGRRAAGRLEHFPLDA
ncbi:MAG TPA: nuclear transport factor 2 family protein [Acidimicrobiia bacterium]|jgi:hypothetical protein